MSYALLRQGKIPDARARFAGNVWNTYNGNYLNALVYNIQGVASPDVNQNQPERAAQLFVWAHAMRAQLGDYRPPVEQNSVESDLVVIHSKLDDNEYSKLYTAGRAMTIEKAVTLHWMSNITFQSELSKLTQVAT